MGEQASDGIAMEIDSIMEPYPDQLSVAIATIDALNLNDSIPQILRHRSSNLYNSDTWEHVLNPRASEKPEASDESAVAALKKKSNDESFYDCNICLDLAKEPVVTCCGHLFCWPCIYRWLNFRTSRIRTKECPVCKGEVTDKDVIPIYGVGNNDEVRNDDSSSEKPQIPPRPNARRVSRVSIFTGPSRAPNAMPLPPLSIFGIPRDSILRPPDEQPRPVAYGLFGTPNFQFSGDRLSQSLFNDSSRI